MRAHTQKPSWQKFTALISLVGLFLNQALPAYGEVSFLTPYQDDQANRSTTRPVEQETTQENVHPSAFESSSDDVGGFVSEELVLEPVDRGNESYITEIYENLEEGLYELQPGEKGEEGTPAAYLAENVTADDLRKLLEYVRENDEEVALLGIGDSFSVFTTGDERFIRSIDPVRDLAESELVFLEAHFHAEGGPSEVDLQDGDDTIRYVITVSEEGKGIVYAYQNGVVIQTLTYEEFAGFAQTLKEQQSISDPAAVRQLLNRYIAGIDNYLQAEDGIPLLDPILYANVPVTVLPGQPVPGIFQTNPSLQDNSFVQVSNNKVIFNSLASQH